MGLEHQKEMFVAAAQVDQTLFNDMVEGSGVLESLPRDGCSKELFECLYTSLMDSSRERDGELARMLVYLMMVPDGQLRSDHLRLLRKVLESVLLSGQGLMPDFASCPIPLIPLDDFVSCLAPLDQRNRSKEVVEQLKKSLEETRRQKEALETNLDEQICKIRNDYENELVKLKLGIEDLQSDLARKNSAYIELEGKLKAAASELENTKKEVERLALKDDDIPTGRIGSNDNLNNGKQERVNTPPPLPPTLTSAPPPPPPLPAFLKKDPAQSAQATLPSPPPLPAFLQNPSAPPMPAFLKNIEAAPPPPPMHAHLLSINSTGAPPPPPMPAFLNKAIPPPPPMPGLNIPPPPPMPGMFSCVPPSPPMPASMHGMGIPPPPPMPGMTGLPPPPPMPNFAMAPPPAPSSLFSSIPKASRKLKPLTLDKLSEYETQDTFWKSKLDTKSIESGLFDLAKLDNLLDAAKLDPRNNSVSEPGPAQQQAQQSAALFDPKQSQNLSIMLHGLKMTDDQIIAGIKKLSSDFPSSLVSDLHDISEMISDQQIAVKEAELKSKGSKLDRPELLFVQLSKLEHWRGHLALMKIQNKANEALLQLHEQLSPLNSACNSLMEASELFQTMGCILYLGNYANQGTNRGNAFGFRVSSLKNIGSGKTSQKDYSVLDYLVESLTARNKISWIELIGWVETVEAARKIAPGEAARQMEVLVTLRNQLADHQGQYTDGSFAKSLGAYVKQLAEQIAKAKMEADASSALLKSTFAFFGESYDKSTHEPFLTAILEFCHELDQSRRALASRELEAEQRAKRLAQAKPRQRSLISQEHKFGCVDNIMDRLRSEITAAAGKPQLRRASE